MAHSLGRYAVVMCTMGVTSSTCSCGSLEAIALVCVPNIAVLDNRPALRSRSSLRPIALKCCLRCRTAQLEHPIFMATAFIVEPAYACQWYVCVNSAEF